ncbi:MAG: hypothetical protein HGB14_12875, partial [Anaerolineaceae bacterium]|nr:hypothetical protein [Anaerolineaceae bacterium]
EVARFEQCFDYSNSLDQNAARRYPRILSDRAWSAVLDSSKALNISDLGWLREVLEGREDRLQNARQSKNRVIRRVVRSNDAQPESHVRASEWVNFTKSVSRDKPFDPRLSEWTALEIIRLLLKPVLQIKGDQSQLDLIHPDNVLIPKKWTSDFLDTSSISWERWRDFIKEHNDVRIISKQKAIYDYRYRANEKNLTGTNPWENRLHSVGHLLWGMLKNGYSIPPIWNYRGNEYASPLPFFSDFSNLAISDQTLRILESCLGDRSAENRTILDKPSLFGWNSGEEPNDAKLDPPHLSNPNELYSAIEQAQKTLVSNQIAVSMNQPRQLIPVRLEGMAVSHIGNQEGVGDA